MRPPIKMVNTVLRLICCCCGCKCWFIWVCFWYIILIESFIYGRIWWRRGNKWGGRESLLGQALHKDFPKSDSSVKIICLSSESLQLSECNPFLSLKLYLRHLLWNYQKHVRNDYNSVNTNFDRRLTSSYIINHKCELFTVEEEITGLKPVLKACTCLFCTLFSLAIKKLSCLNGKLF